MKKLYAHQILVLLFLVGIQKSILGQNVGIGTNTPHPTSKLEIESQNSGLLIPRLTTAQRDAIANPATSLLIYNVDTDCIEMYSATNQWISIGCGCQLPGTFFASSASSVTAVSFIANWSTASGATSYFLDVATDPSFTNFVSGYNNLNVGNVISYNVSGLNCNTTYYYRLRAINSCGVTAYTNTINVTTTECKMIYDYIGTNTQTFVVPSGVNQISIKLWGAGGGGGGYDANGNGGNGGGGAFVSNTSVSVSPGDILTIYVGGGGTYGSNCVAGTGGGTGGWGYGIGGNGGNAGGSGFSGAGGGGGGASAIVNQTTSTLIAVAGGGGGGGGGGNVGVTNGGNGGGGGQNGSPAGSGSAGGTAGGSANEHGTNGQNRSGDGGGAGGGGGGWNGGTGGTTATCDCGAAGGGGGNSFGGSIINATGQNAANNTDPDLCTNCARGGNGDNDCSGTPQNGGHGRVVII